MRQAGKPLPGWASSLMGGGHWLSEFTGGREYLGYGVPRSLMVARFQMDNDSECFINFATGQIGFGTDNDDRNWTATFSIGDKGNTWWPGLHGSGRHDWLIWAYAYFPEFHFTQSQLNMIRHCTLIRHVGRDNAALITQQPSAANGWVMKWYANDHSYSAGYYEIEIVLWT